MSRVRLRGRRRSVADGPHLLEPSGVPRRGKLPHQSCVPLLSQMSPPNKPLTPLTGLGGGLPTHLPTPLAAPGGSPDSKVWLLRGHALMSSPCKADSPCSGRPCHLHTASSLGLPGGQALGLTGAMGMPKPLLWCARDGSH